MQEEKNGKQIVNIKFSKNKISIFFSDESSIKISENTYSHFYLYIDKRISAEEYKEIEEFEKLHSTREYAINLLSNGMYTEKELYSRLISKKKLKDSDAKKIIDYLLEHNLLNDQKYFVDYVENLHLKKNGKNKIIQKCYEKGFNKKMIDSLVFDDELEKDKAETLLRKYIDNKKKNFVKLKESGYTFLLNQGFDFNICSNAIKIIDDIYDFSKERDLLERELNKYILSHRVDLNNYEEYQKVLSVFTRKGYSYDEIKNIIKGVKENEIC